MSGWRWGVGLALGVLLFLCAGPEPVRSDGTRTSSSIYSDLRQFQKELRSGGAFKFMEETEDLIRSGQFEQAFSRYLILKAHIRGQALYAGLNAMVDQRLHFLKAQMRLAEIPTYAGLSQKFKRRVRRSPSADLPGSSGPDQKGAKASASPVVIPAAAKAGDQESQASKPSSDEKPTESILPPVHTPDQAKTQQPEEGKSPKEETQEEKPKETKPATPPSIWDKLKRRLKFW